MEEAVQGQLDHGVRLWFCRARKKGKIVGNQANADKSMYVKQALLIAIEMAELY
jgi:hypothetical protein